MRYIFCLLLLISCYPRQIYMTQRETLCSTPPTHLYDSAALQWCHYANKDAPLTCHYRKGGCWYRATPDEDCDWQSRTPQDIVCKDFKPSVQSRTDI